MDNSYLALEPGDEEGLTQPLGSSITCRIALGPQQGRKAFSLQNLPPQGSLEESSTQVAKASGFLLHAGVAAARHERHKLERLCRYITRPAISERRLSLTPAGDAQERPSSRPRTATAPRMWCSNPWISWSAWRRQNRRLIENNVIRLLLLSHPLQ